MEHTFNENAVRSATAQPDDTGQIDKLKRLKSDLDASQEKVDGFKTQLAQEAEPFLEQLSSKPDVETVNNFIAIFGGMDLGDDVSLMFREVLKSVVTKTTKVEAQVDGEWISCRITLGFDRSVGRRRFGILESHRQGKTMAPASYEIPKNIRILAEGIDVVPEMYQR